MVYHGMFKHIKTHLLNILAIGNGNKSTEVNVLQYIT